MSTPFEQLKFRHEELKQNNFIDTSNCKIFISELLDNAKEIDTIPQRRILREWRNHWEGVLCDLLRKKHRDLMNQHENKVDNLPRKITAYMKEISDCTAYILAKDYASELRGWYQYWLYISLNEFDIVPKDAPLQSARPFQFFDIPKVILSYAPADKIQVEELYEVLINGGIEPWLEDKDLWAGMRLSQIIKDYDFLLICLSPDSFQANGSLEERMSHYLDWWRDKEPHLIGVLILRLAECEVPHELPNPVDLFSPTGLDMEQLNNLIDFIKREHQEKQEHLENERQAKLKRQQEGQERLEHERQTGIPSPYGPLPADSPFYIERESDKLCWQILSQPHATMALHGKEKMGKTSLVERIIAFSQERVGKQAILIDFRKAFSKKDFDLSEEAFYKLICELITQQLNMEFLEDKWLKRNISAKLKCEQYFLDHILPQTSSFILVLDDVGKMNDNDTRSEFFSMLRVFHQNAQRQGNIFNKMTILFTLAESPLALIPNINQSPFNIAQNIYLENFNLTDIRILISVYQKQGTNLIAYLTEQDIKSLLVVLDKLTKGHPFLTQLALYELSSNRLTIDSLLKQEIHLNNDFWQRLKFFQENKI